jgi:hypothetical protein
MFLGDEKTLVSSEYELPLSIMEALERSQRFHDLLFCYMHAHLRIDMVPTIWGLKWAHEYENPKGKGDHTSLEIGKLSPSHMDSHV